MKTRIILYSLLVTALFSCQKDAEYVTLSHDLEFFNHIKLHNSFVTVLHESEDFRIEITADKKRLKHVEFSISDTLLEISNTKSAGWLNPKKNEIEIHIYAQPLSLVEAEESCIISTANAITSNEFGILLKSKVNEADLELNCGTFYYWNNVPAGGKLTLSGTSEIAKIWNHALMSVDASTLNTEIALVENNSKGVIKVAPSVKLEYSILDVGNIELYSNPAIIVEQEVSSSGELVQF